MAKTHRLEQPLLKILDPPHLDPLRTGTTAVFPQRCRRRPPLEAWTLELDNVGTTRNPGGHDQSLTQTGV